MKNFLALTSDKKFWFVELTLRELGLTDKVKFLLEDKTDSSYLSMMETIRRYIELNIILIHYCVNFDLDMLKELCDFLSKKAKEKNLSGHAIYGDEIEGLFR